MPQMEIKLNTFKVHKKNEWSKDEAYLWCFGVVIDADTLRTQNYILKTHPHQGNLGKGFKKGESRPIPANVGHITRNITPVNIGDGNRLAIIGVITLAWEEDNTPNAKVVQAYEDSVTVLNRHIQERVRNMNTRPLSDAEIRAITNDLKQVIERRFRSAVHWYNPFSWDPDDFIGFAQMIETVRAGQALTRPIDFTYKGDGAEYQVLGQLRFIP